MLSTTSEVVVSRRSLPHLLSNSEVLVLPTIHGLRKKISGHLNGGSLGQQAIRGSAWLMTGRITVQVSQLIRLAIVARFVGPSEFGIMAIALLVLQVLEAFTNPGLDQALIQRKTDITPLLSSVFWFKIARGLLLCGVVVGAAGYVASFFEVPESSNVVRTAALILAIRGFQNPAIAQVHRDLRFKSHFLLDITSTASGFAASMMLLLLTHSVWVLIVSLLIEELVRTIGSYVIQRWTPSFSFSWKKIQSIGKFGRWVTIGTMVTYVSTQLDSIVVGRLMDASSLGIYQMAMRVSQLPATQIGNVGGTVAFPILSKLHDDQSRFRDTYIKIIGSLFFLSLAASAFLLIFAEPIIVLAFGDQWTDAIPVMRVLAIAGFVRGILTTAGRIFYSVAKPEYNVYLNAFRMLAIVTFVYPMVTQFGLIGAAWTFTLSLVAIIPVYLVLIRRAADIGIRDHLSIFTMGRMNSSLRKGQQLNEGR